MRKMKLAAALLGSVGSFAAMPQAANAIVINEFLTAAPDNSVSDVDLWFFKVTTGSQYLLRTWSYAGGDFTDGAASIHVDGGGFDPVLGLYNSAGNLITFNDDGGSNVAADAITGAQFDSYISIFLNPGIYFTTVAAYPLFTGNPTPPGSINTNPAFFDPSAFATGNLTDTTGHLRSTKYTLQIIPTGAVPEPASWALMITGFGLVGSAMRYRRATRVRTSFV